MKRREFIKNTAIFGTMTVFGVANLSPNLLFGAENLAKSKNFIKFNADEFAKFSTNLKENLSKFAKNHKILIVYYTRTLNTKIIAEYLSWLFGGDLFALQTLQSYPSDLAKMVEIAVKETNEDKFPPLKEMPNLEPYDTIFIASPIWNATIAPPMVTFLANADFKDKTLFAFLTHCGYGIGNSSKKIAKLAKNALLKDIFSQKTICEKDEPNLKTKNLSLISQNLEHSLIDTAEMEKISLSLK